MGDFKTGEMTFDIKIDPNPMVVDTSVSIHNVTVKVKVEDVPGFKVSLEPKFSWNPVNDILTAAGTIANLFSSQISDKVVTAVKGYSVDVFTVPDISVDKRGINLILSPGNLELSNEKGMLMVTGTISISG